MRYLLTFCAGLLGIAGLIVWAWRTKDPDRVTAQWRRDEQRASFRNQFTGVNWRWPLEK